MNIWLFAIIVTSFTLSTLSKPKSIKLDLQTTYTLKTKVQKPDYSYFLDFFSSKDLNVLKQSLKYIRANWNESFEILALETIYFSDHSKSKYELLRILEDKTGKHFKLDFNKWFEYLWNKPKTYTDNYFKFKAEVHGLIDLKFYKYFSKREKQSKIRLDEVRWGGVVQDGIPPLRNPEMVDASLANYLEDSNIIFGIKVNGDVRAYPKRVLAWHEMFTDTVGDIPVAGVYCTLCGTVILYKTTHNSKQYKLGTSGFLYRSNKMMYDKKTQSLWSTSLGKPIIGPLVNKNIQLDFLSVVTTTWGAWKKLHPNTKVLSLNTGHQRNYGEGVAYHNYFSTDELMFNVPKTNTKLLNKDEVLVVRTPLDKENVMAISSKFLKQHPIYSNTINNQSFVVFTDTSGAHRTFYSEKFIFKKYDGKNRVIDNSKNEWLIDENQLKNIKTGQILNRLHTYNAFWFGLYAAFPNLTLIK